MRKRHPAVNSQERTSQIPAEPGWRGKQVTAGYKSKAT